MKGLLPRPAGHIRNSCHGKPSPPAVVLESQGQGLARSSAWRVLGKCAEFLVTPRAKAVWWRAERCLHVVSGARGSCRTPHAGEGATTTAGHSGHPKTLQGQSSNQRRNTRDISNQLCKLLRAVPVWQL